MSILCLNVSILEAKMQEGARGESFVLKAKNCGAVC